LSERVRRHKCRGCPRIGFIYAGKKAVHDCRLGALRAELDILVHRLPAYGGVEAQIHDSRSQQRIRDEA
jgi:hypothetical protein